jgi:hypothetical protein
VVEVTALVNGSLQSALLAAYFRSDTNVSEEWLQLMIDASMTEDDE